MTSKGLLSNLGQKYAKIFAIDEIAQSLRLKMTFAAVWFLAVWDLRDYARSPNQFVSPQNPYQLTCWPYFENCTHVFLFAALPSSYAYTFWMAVLMGLLILAMVSLFRKRTGLAHAALSIVVVWNFVFHFILVNYQSVNFDLLYLIPAIVLLFTHHKLANLRFVWAFLCLLMARTKISDGWILGTYFSSTSLGAPLVPDFLTPLLTNLIIILEIVFSWGLLSSRKNLRNISFWGWTGLFIFSVIYTGYKLPVIGLFYLWSLFAAPDVDDSFSSTTAYSKGLVFVVGLLCVSNLLFTTIPGESEYTFQGVEYGFNSLDINYQCVGDIKHLNASGQVVNQWIKRVKRPYVPCYPEAYFQFLKNLCPKYPVGDTLKWSMSISKNGGPFYEIIKTENVCALDYKPFTANAWIKSPDTQTAITGYPERNSFYDSDNSTGKVQILPSPLEPPPFTYSFLEKNKDLLLSAYRLFWFAIFCCSLLILFRSSRRRFWNRSGGHGKK